MTLERTPRKCARPDCPNTFRRRIGRGAGGRPRLYCTQVCVHLAQREREKAERKTRKRSASAQWW